MQRDKLIHTRFIAYHAFIAPHIGLKSIPSIDKFMPIDGEERAARRVSDEAKQRFLVEYQEYLKAKK